MLAVEGSFGRYIGCCSVSHSIERYNVVRSIPLVLGSLCHLLDIVDIELRGNVDLRALGRVLRVRGCLRRLLGILQRVDSLLGLYRRGA